MGRTRSASSDDIPIRDYVDAVNAEKEKALHAALLSQEKAVNAALMASDKAITKAEANAEKWRENANEWRGAMSDRDRELPSRREVEGTVAALEARLRLLEDALKNAQGRTEGINLSAGVIVGAITLTATVLGIVIVLANVLTG